MVLTNNTFNIFECREKLSELLSMESFPISYHGAKELLGNKKIICYGAGNGFNTFATFVLKPNGYIVNTIIDQKFLEKIICDGVQLCSPRDFQPTEEEKQDSIVVITIGKTEYHKEILQYLHSLGFHTIIFAWEIYEYLRHYSSHEIIDKGYSFYCEERDNILKCFDLLGDDESKLVFSRILFTHLLRKPFAIPSRPINEQYFPKDIILSKGYSRVINCGSYDGDTIRTLNSSCGKIETLICFEPDLDNFRALSCYLRDNAESIAQNIVAVPCGVYDREAQFRFAPNKMNSAISAQDDIFIQCFALDNILPNFMPTFICMDVEGAESEALKGAEILIKKNRPDLGISVYHYPNHIWEIPLWIDGLGLGYKLLLRNYTGFVTETVLYASIA